MPFLPGNQQIQSHIWVWGEEMCADMVTQILNMSSLDYMNRNLTQKCNIFTQFTTIFIRIMLHMLCLIWSKNKCWNRHWGRRSRVKHRIPVIHPAYKFMILIWLVHCTEYAHIHALASGQNVKMHMHIEWCQEISTILSPGMDPLANFSHCGFSSAKKLPTQKSIWKEGPGH